MACGTKTKLLNVGYELALKHGLRYLTSAVMSEATGMYRYALLQHYKSVACFREAVKAHGVAKGAFAADADTRSPRLAPAERKEELLTEAFKQAKENGLKTVTRPSVAGALEVSDGLVTRYFGNLQGLRDAVLAKAVVGNELDIIADALELDMNVHHVPPDLVSQARKILAA